jgi:hypothetical protein
MTQAAGGVRSAVLAIWLALFVVGVSGCGSRDSSGEFYTDWDLAGGCTSTEGGASRPSGAGGVVELCADVDRYDYLGDLCSRVVQYQRAAGAADSSLRGIGRAAGEGLHGAHQWDRTARGCYRARRPCLGRRTPSSGKPRARRAEHASDSAALVDRPGWSDLVSLCRLSQQRGDEPASAGVRRGRQGTGRAAVAQTLRVQPKVCAIGGVRRKVRLRDRGQYQGHGPLWLSGMAGRDVFNPAQSLVRGLDPVRGSNGATSSGPNGPAARSARLGARNGH